MKTNLFKNCLFSLLFLALALLPGKLIAARLSLPETLSAKVNEEFEVPVSLDTEGVSIFGASVALDFPQNIELTGIVPKAKEATTLKTFFTINENGELGERLEEGKPLPTGTSGFAAAAIDSEGNFTNPFNGSLDLDNSLAILKFKALEKGEVTISFDPSSHLVDDATGNSFSPSTNSLTASIAGVIPEGVRIPNPLKANTIEEFIQDLIDFIFYLALALTPLMIIIAGFYYLTAVGDPKRIQTAKDIILYTCIGFGILLLAKVLISVIISALGG